MTYTTSARITLSGDAWTPPMRPCPARREHIHGPMEIEHLRAEERRRVVPLAGLSLLLGIAVVLAGVAVGG